MRVWLRVTSAYVLRSGVTCAFSLCACSTLTCAFFECFAHNEKRARIREGLEPRLLIVHDVMSGVGESQREAMTYPPDWEDEERMHFLLGPLSPAPSAVRDLSPSNQKVQFWSSLVLAVCRQLHQPVFSAGQMARRCVGRHARSSRGLYEQTWLYIQDVHVG